MRVGAIQLCSERDEPFNCGYCGQQSAFNEGDFFGFLMTPASYELLVDRNIRRCGYYFYRRAIHTCCPSQEIRCEALKFRPSKVQRRVLRQMREFLLTGKMPKSRRKLEESSANAEPIQGKPHTIDLSGDYSAKICMPHVSSDDTKSLVEPRITVCDEQPHFEANKTVIDSLKKLIRDHGDSKAKFKRMKRRVERLMKNNGSSFDEAIASMIIGHKKRRSRKLPEQSFEKLIEIPTNGKHRLELKFACTSSSNYGPIEPVHELYKKYQNVIHKDDESEWIFPRFRSFLIDNPFQVTQQEYSEDGVPLKPGTYHLQYWLDGKLLAVSVLDILNKYLSSVYFFYDPNYSALSLGTYSAMSEIAVTRKLHQYNAQMEYYTMGFYIHTCKKMNYKASFMPSYLLCQKSLTWHPIEKCLPLLDADKFACFVPDGEDEDSKGVTFDDVLVLHCKEIISYKTYTEKNGNILDDAVNSLIKIVGRKFLEWNLIHLF